MTASRFLIHGVAASTPEQLPGDLESLEESGLRAIVSRIPLEEANELFTDEVAAQELAVRHHDILVQVMHVTDVLPVRLGSVYSSEEAVRSLLRSEEAFFLNGLENVRGTAEYVLSIDRAVPVAEKTPSLPASGRSYLAARRARMQARRESRSASDVIVENIVSELSVLARSVARETARKDRPGEIARVAFLAGKVLDPRNVAHLEGISKTAEQSGFKISVTGPWPPYSFVGEAA